MEAAGVKDITINNRVRVIFTSLLIEGQPLTSILLISIYY